MIPTQPTQNIATYASEAPAEMLIPPGGTPVPQEEYQDGVRPLDTLPAAWWNWLWQKFSLEEQNIVSVLNSFHSELVNLLTEGGITTPSESSVTQVADAVKNIHERLATTAVAGSIKADNSTFGAIDVNSSTGVATMNGAGNGALDTTPQNLTDAINELVSRVAALENAPAADSVPSGVMAAYCGETIPSGWLLCDGRALNRTTYASLFTAIGTKWGAGDGSTTFNIPDMRDRGTMGAGTKGSLGEYKNSATAVNGLDTYSKAASRVTAFSYDTAMQSGSSNNGYILYSTGVAPVNPSYQLFAQPGNYHNDPDWGGNYYSFDNLRSKDTETWAKHARVNYIIKY